MISSKSLNKFAKTCKGFEYKLKGKFKSFEEASEYARSLGLKNREEWNMLRRNGNLPNDIPTNPDVPYKKKGWKGMGDWLGTGNIANKDKNFIPFKKARKFARSLNLKNRKEWDEFCKSGNLPDNIPRAPTIVYKKSGWSGMGDWLGTEKLYLSFKDARKFVISLNLKSMKEWYKYSKNGRPDNIPGNPRHYFSGWISWGDWLGTGNVANQGRIYRSFEEARKFARSLNLKNRKEWDKFCVSGNKPDDIPRNSNIIYIKDWKGIKDWLGANVISNKDKIFRTFNKARKYVRSLKFKRQKEWKEFCRSGNKLDDIPNNPNIIYKDRGWGGMGDWLGTGRVASRDKIFRTFNKARKYVRSLKFKKQKEWIDFCQGGNKPDDIPSHPYKIYKTKGWIDWYDWFGKPQPKSRLK